MVKRYYYPSFLKITPFGGVDNVTKNMFVYEYGEDILVVDCGVGFPDEPSSGEELVIPDFSYLLENKERIRGVAITHAHFDHYGAVPYLLEKINVPVYASPLTWEFIKKDLEEFNLRADRVDLHLLSANQEMIKIGPFYLTPFHINHSVPQSLGFFIRTPVGNIFHIADYKFDWTPIDESPFDIAKLCRLVALQKPLLLLSDCLGSNKPGHTLSERSIQEVFENLMIRAEGRVLITTVSSNISRMKQAIWAAANIGRKVSFVGRSVEESSQIARLLGYFSSLKRYIVPLEKIKRFRRSDLCLLVAGCYGQTDSALSEISRKKHPWIKLEKGDVVIFSADPSPPGVLVKVNKTIDNLTRLGANVYYHEIQNNLHVSGHGTAEDIKMLFSLVKPKWLMPIGGDYRHMHSYSLLAQQMGYREEQILLLKEKTSVEIDHEGRLAVNN